MQDEHIFMIIFCNERKNIRDLHKKD